MNFCINNKQIGQNSPVYFIADIAANHDGSLKRAKELIYLAKDSGADCAKFQHFLPHKIVSDFGFKNLKDIKTHQSSWAKSVYEIYDEYHLKRDWTLELYETCKKAEIEFMTTPYDYEILEEINPYINAYKIGSGDINWIDFIEKVASYKKPVLLATGASNLEEVKRAVEAVMKYSKEFVLMQCNTNYSASLENFKYINLNVLNTYKNLYPNAILGLSDHTPGHSTVLGAIALGAKVIEKHFTDNNSRQGPDHKFAMTPKSWAYMIEVSRELELALGDGIKRIEENEKETVVVQRRSIRLNKDLEKGRKITKNDLDFLRPAPKNSFAPFEVDLILNKTLVQSKSKGDCLYKNDLVNLAD